MSQHVNETITKMVKDLKRNSLGAHDFDTPIKRSISSESMSSLDEVTPIKKFKQEIKFDMTYVGSPREMRRLRADLVESRNTILNLENRINHMHSVRKEMQVMFDNESQSLKRQHEYDRKTIEELETQLQNLRKRESSLKQDIIDFQKKYDELKAGSEEKIYRLEKDLSDVKDESQTIETESSVELSKLKRQIKELETMLQAAEEDAEAQKKLAAELSNELAEKNGIERELELKDNALQKIKLQVKELEYAKESFQEFQEQAKSQAHIIQRYFEMEKENEVFKEENIRLKDEVKNKLLLEEEVYDLNNRLVKFKDMERKYSEIQVQDCQNRVHLNEWRAVARGILETTENDSALSHLLRAHVERLQQQELTLTAEKIDLESQLKATSLAAKIARAELEKNQKLLAELRQVGEQRQSLIHRMQKKLQLVSRERDSYRLQLDTYERDLTIMGNLSTAGAASTGSNSSLALLQSQKERIDNLEKMIEGYRDMVAKLENDLQVAQPQLHGNNDLVPVKEQQIARLQSEVEKLKAENESLREQRERLEVQLEAFSVGDDTLRGGQVLHLAENPLAECVAQRVQLVEQLQAEVQRLKAKMKKMEEGRDVSKVGDISVCPQEVLNLREQIKQHETQTQKLKDYCKSSIQDFRNMMYMLFGYQIDKTGKKYKLRSMYAESAEDQLWFEVNENGDLNLMETEFSRTLDEMIDLHLKHQNSIPVFLSAITISLFSSKTITQPFVR